MLVVEENMYPAHSQFVASYSRLIYDLIEACPSFTRDQPLVIRSALEGYRQTDAHTFLKHVYTDCAVQSSTEALQLLTIADQFDSPVLMDKAIAFLEQEGQGSFLQANCGPTGVLHWLQVAERFSLAAFKQRCVEYAADHFDFLQKDLRLLEMPPNTSLALMQALQKVIERRGQVVGFAESGGVGNSRTDKYWQSYYCCNSCRGHRVCWATDFDYGRASTPGVSWPQHQSALCQSMLSVDLKQVSQGYGNTQPATVPKDTQQLIIRLQQMLKPHK